MKISVSFPAQKGAFMGAVTLGTTLFVERR